MRIDRQLVRLLVALIAMSAVYIITLLWVAYAMNSVMNAQIESSTVVRQMFTYLEKNQSVIGEQTQETKEHTEVLVEKVEEASKKLDTAAVKSDKAAKAAATASANTKATKGTVEKVGKKIEDVAAKIPPPPPEKPKRRSIFGK